MKADLELKIQQQKGTIDFNSAELKKELTQKMAEYKGEVVTKDSEAIVKKEVASLRKLQTEVEDKRKEIKCEAMEPYKAFEQEVKELIKIIDQPINYLNDQLKEIERLRVEDKKKIINDLFVEVFANTDLITFISLESIYNDKWENKTTTKKAIKENMQFIVEKVNADLTILEASQSDIKDEVLEQYKKDTNLTAALTKINQYEANKKKALELAEKKKKAEEEARHQAEIERAKADERQRLADIEKAKTEERAKAEALKVEEVEETPFQQSDEPDDLPFVQDDTETVYYKVVASEEELNQVEIALHSIGIEFERVKGA